MRLLNTTTFELKEFFDRNIPKYAILSHTWGEDEVTFDELQAGTGKNKQGYKKIEQCCAQAFEDGLSWAWVDTCCIQKTSSAELSEAINSMFRWYKNSQICYAYLADVPDGDDVLNEESAFSKSKWHTRGWTLQELLAPTNVVFYSENWRSLGTRLELGGIISRFSGISRYAITASIRFESFSIAQRMSWASGRETTRLEDTAYCLMGIFDVNMPLIYGEGEKAFQRLQEEIMKASYDHSLFAWRLLDSCEQPLGLLAPSPAEFRYSSHIIPTTARSSYWHYHTSTTNVVTNRGIQVEVQLQLMHDREFCIALLACEHRPPSFRRNQAEGVAIVLCIKDGIYYRVGYNWLLFLPGATGLLPSNHRFRCKQRIATMQVHIPKSLPSSFVHQSSRSWYLLCVDLSLESRTESGTGNWANQDYVVDAIYPQQTTRSILFFKKNPTAYHYGDFFGSILLHKTNVMYSNQIKYRYITVFVGISKDCQPWCHLASYERKRNVTASLSGKLTEGEDGKPPGFAKLPPGKFLASPCHELEVERGRTRLVAETLEDTGICIGDQLERWTGSVIDRQVIRSKLKVFRVRLRIEDLRSGPKNENLPISEPSTQPL